MNNVLLSLNEICEMTGKSYTSVLRYVKSGKLKSVTMTIQGKPCYKVKKSDLERFLEKQGISMNIHGNNNRISMNSQGISMNNHGELLKETLKEVVRETISEERNQLMRPLEEQALFLVGELKNEVKHLQAEKETLRQENELLREQVKVLPGPTELENKDNIILLLEKEKERVLKQAEEEQIKLKTEAQEVQKQKEELEVRLKTETEEAQRKKEELEQKLKQEAEEKFRLMEQDKRQKEEEKDYLATIEELKKRLQAEESRPWWKKLW